MANCGWHMDAKQDANCSYTLTRGKRSLRNWVKQQDLNQTIRGGSWQGNLLLRRICSIRALCIRKNITSQQIKSQHSCFPHWVLFITKKSNDFFSPMENVNTVDDRQFWEATSVLYGETWSAAPKITAVETQTRSHLSNWLGKRRKLDCWLELSWSHLRQQGSNRAVTHGLGQAGGHRSQGAGGQQINLCPLKSWKAFLMQPIPEGSTIGTLVPVTSLAPMQSHPTGVCHIPDASYLCSTLRVQARAYYTATLSRLSKPPHWKINSKGEWWITETPSEIIPSLLIQA